MGALIEGEPEGVLFSLGLSSKMCKLVSYKR